MIEYFIAVMGWTHQIRGPIEGSEYTPKKKNQCQMDSSRSFFVHESTSMQGIGKLVPVRNIIVLEVAVKYGETAI
jgi:hypothetical protein